MADLLDREQVLVTGPVVAELLAGTRDRRRGELWSVLQGLGWAAVDRHTWWLAGTAAAALRELGATVPLTDLVIAAAAVQAGAELWTRDRDFVRVGEAMPALTLYSSADPLALGSPGSTRGSRARVPG